MYVEPRRTAGFEKKSCLWLYTLMNYLEGELKWLLPSCHLTMIYRIRVVVHFDLIFTPLVRAMKVLEERRTLNYDLQSN